jgi:hypothetical protein
MHEILLVERLGGYGITGALPLDYVFTPEFISRGGFKNLFLCPADFITALCRGYLSRHSPLSSTKSFEHTISSLKSITSDFLTYILTTGPNQEAIWHG